MERQSEKSEQFFSISKTMLYALGAYLILEISLGAANGKARKKVKRRANGKCEGCDRQLEKIGSRWQRHNKGKAVNVFGHLNHANDERYHDADNLRHFCRFCEALYHAKHIGQAHLIGLTEIDNSSAAMAWFTVLVRESPRKEFMDFYRENKPVLDTLLAQFKKDLESFTEKHAYWRR